MGHVSVHLERGQFQCRTLTNRRLFLIFFTPLDDLRLFVKCLSLTQYFTQTRKVTTEIRKANRKIFKTLTNGPGIDAGKEAVLYRALREVL